MVAAYSDGIALFSNLQDGILCIFGHSSITRGRGYPCSEDKSCFDHRVDNCCDSCAGEYYGISPIHAGYLLLYVIN